MYWEEQKRRGKKTRTVRYRASNEFLNYEHLLCDFGTNINKGMYQIQFTFIMPHNLPPTLSFKGSSNNAKASVGYSTIAKFRHPSHDKVLRYRFPLNLSPPSRMPIYPNPVKSEVNQSIQCCCLDRGRVKGEFFLDKGTYAIGDTINLHIRIEEIERSVECIEITLQKRADMRASKSRAFFRDLQTYKLPGIDASQYDKTITHQLVVGHGASESICPTYAGSVLSVTYRLNIIFDMEGCCTGEAEINLPLMLVNPQYVPEYVPYPVEVPAYWMPQDYGNVDFGRIDYQPDPAAVELMHQQQRMYQEPSYSPF